MFGQLQRWADLYQTQISVAEPGDTGAAKKASSSMVQASRGVCDSRIHQVLSTTMNFRLPSIVPLSKSRIRAEQRDDRT